VTAGYATNGWGGF